MLFKLLATLMLVGLVSGRAYHVSRRDEFLMHFEQECVKNSGDPHIFRKVEAASTKFSDCFMAEIDVNSLTVLSRTPTEDDSKLIEDFAKLMCSKKAPLQACFFDLVDGTLPCVEADLRDRVNDSKKAFAELGDYVCSNDAQIVTQLMDRNAILCTESKVPHINRCMDDVTSVDLEQISEPQACRVVNNSIDCMVNTMRTCPNKVHADFLQRVYDTLIVGSRCEKSTVEEDDITVNNI